MNELLEQRERYLWALRDITSPEERSEPQERRRRFLWLPEYREALDPRVLVVRGERGAGKTALFHVFSMFASREGRLESVEVPAWMRWESSFSLEKNRWLVGFSEEGTQHPSPLVLATFYREAPQDSERLRHFWFGSLVGLLGEWSLGEDAERKAAMWEKLSPFWEVWRAARHAPSVWAPAVGAQVSLLLGVLDEIEQRLEREGRYLFVVYDQLDRIGLGDAVMQKESIKILLQIWQSFSSRYKRLRAKIFLREDLYQSVSRSYTDAGKLESLSCSMRWSVENLYRVLYRRMLASEELRGWLVALGFPVGIEDPEWGAYPPSMPPETEDDPQLSIPEVLEGAQGRSEKLRSVSQLSLMEAMVGRTMGAGVNKGYVHRWIPNHLSDANKAIVPRSMLNLFSFAASDALKRTPRAQAGRLLHHTALMEGLREASVYRMKELQEEYLFVQRLRLLRGMTLFAAQEEVEQKLSELPYDGEEDGYGSDGKRVFTELERLGVLKVRKERRADTPDERRVDMPDLYRLGLEIKRRGGVARA